MPSPLLQRAPLTAGPLGRVPSIVRDVLAAPGQPLESGARDFLEPRFNHDFRQVRIHADGRAAQSAQAINALAYTVGPHIVFGAGRYAPTTRDGRSLLAHELTHSLQQGMTVQPGSDAARLADPHGPAEREAERAAAQVAWGRPFHPSFVTGPQVARQAEETVRPIDEVYPLEPGEAEAERFAVLTLSVVKDPILQALRRYDSITFLNRLRAVDPADRRRLLADQPFLDEIRHSLHGLAFWTVLLILEFGNTRPENVRRLYRAVSDRDIRLVRDLIRAFPELRSEAQTPGVREMLNYELRGTPAHDEILGLINQRETTGRSSLLSSYQEVHYETRSGTWDQMFGSSELRRFTGTTAYELARTANELRVIVRIHLVSDTTTNATYYPEDAKANEWRSGIEAAWNKPFYAWNGTTQLTIVFVPIFTAQSPHHTVLVTEGRAPSQEAGLRGDAAHWFTSFDGLTAAHEFGHMLGNPDEYRLPGTIAEIPASQGLSAEEARRSSVEGITGTPGASDTTLAGIMGASTGTALPRHIQPILDFYNRSGKPSTESDYRLL